MCLKQVLTQQAHYQNIPVLKVSVVSSQHLPDHISLNIITFVCRDSDMSSSVEGLKSRLTNYDPGMDSGDELEEEDFSV